MKNANAASAAAEEKWLDWNENTKNQPNRIQIKSQRERERVVKHKQKNEGKSAKISIAVWEMIIGYI